MKGKYKIIVESKKIKYEFEIKRNITILKGDSATGKTTLMELIEEYYEKGNSTGININCSKECVTLSGRDWKVKLNNIKDSIVFIDEFNPFLTTEEFAKEIQKTNNYYVLITRENLYNLPYSVDEIYGIRENNKYPYIKKTYNELYKIYSKISINDILNPKTIIVEDSNSGYEFFSNVCNKDIEVFSSNGKTQIGKKLNLLSKKEDVLIIADGAAFGSEIDKIDKLIRFRNTIHLYLPESFEWLILKSGILKNIEKILSKPYDYIESENYFSWERYFTELLIKETQNTYLKYNKKKLNSIYFKDEISNKILDVMTNIKIK